MARPPKNKAAPEPVAPVAATPPTIAAAVPPTALGLKQAPPLAQAPQAPAQPPTVVVDVGQFMRVRDSVYQRLQTIVDLMTSFSRDYLRQTNLLIGEGINLENAGELDRMSGALTNLMPAAVVAPQPPVEEKKERKKRTHDPNAPKRPLTPYFLYMQTARPIIASDLGDQVPKGAVQDEGQRRWSVMPPAEKSGWNQAYQYNLRLYNARVHSYKQGNADARNMTDEEARAYADQHGVLLPPLAQVAEEAPANDQEAIAEQLQQSAAAEASPEVASEEEPTAPVTKTPRKKETRKRKSTATPAPTVPAAPAAPAEPEATKPAEAATPASPEAKKRKRTSRAAEQVEEPKKSGRKKKSA